MEYFDLLEKIYKKGKLVSPRGKEILELIDQKIILKDYNYFESRPARSYLKTSRYFWKELAWYFSGNTSNKFIVPHAKMWKNIENSDGTANSNYGHLVFYKQHGNAGSAFNWAMDCLFKDKLSRQAIITYNDGSYNIRDNKDYICTQQMHFMIRDEKLICIIYLRSSDAIYGLQYNCPWWSIVQQQLFLSLKPYYEKLKLGEIIVNIGSAHIYKNHWELVDQMLTGDKKFYYLKLKKIIPIGESCPTWYDNAIRKYFEKQEINYYS